MQAEITESPGPLPGFAFSRVVVVVVVVVFCL